MQKGMYAVDVAITRYYRIWKHADEGEERSHFIEKVKLDIVDNQDNGLDIDPQLEIEHSDIQSVWIDYDSLQLDDEEEDCE